MAMVASFVNQLLSLYIFVIFASVILSWLIAFNVVNRNNQFVEMIWRFTTAATEPLLRPIRNVLPNLGGIDISPIILLFAINALQVGLNTYVFAPAVTRGL
ncbi:MAG: YggT family protein [Pseudomonadota bacterium]